MAIYFFLAGVVVTNRPYMCLTPIASAVLVLVFAFWKTVSDAFSFYREMQGNAKVWWTTYMVRLFYAGFMALLSTLHISIYGMLPTLNNADPWAMTLYCSPVCITLGNSALLAVV